MSPELLKKVLKSEPFVPFRLHLSDGTHHVVTGPEWLVVGVRSSVLTIPSKRHPELWDDLIFIDNLHITKTTPLTQPATAE